jgi:transposase-like protein
MFSPEQIKELEKNNNVIKCSAKSITYSNEFKLAAVKRYYEKGVSPKLIFSEAGFDVSWLGKTQAKNNLRHWRQKYNASDKDYSFKEGRGGSGRSKKKIRYRNDNEKMEYLETKIAYLEAENDFLAKLRGLKRE